MKKDVDSMKKTSGNMDFGMFVITIILLCIGLVMVASASSYHSLIYYGNSNELFNKQLVFAILGIVAMIIISRIDYKKYKKWSYLAFIIAAILLLLVITPLGVTRNGAQRWLGVGETLQIQPSEIMKPVLVLAIATYLSRNVKKLNNIKGYIVPIIMLLIVVLLMYLQKHMSGMLVLIVAAVSVIFASGIKLKFRAIAAGVLVIGMVGAAFVMAEDFRLQRILAFMNPEENLKDDNWQAAQSLYAIGSGGLFGRGLGQSRQKYLWLPEAQNDFIFSILAEELGFVGCIVVIVLFALFIWRGIIIAMKAPDMFGSLLATGITALVMIQVVINIAVVTNTIPNTGMSLPFFSAGGTALIMLLGMCGILLNISKSKSKV